ncbi:uncharacterized protein LOC116105675 [Pistacia vera]|uniref:uncharacterized protein LOC116105675 n=1 Tax=Pistacia vera TaxID=55513 RepID=UPI001263A359|nr:uncharacterized protein LOC116105675 [Pistacia vera]
MELEHEAYWVTKFLNFDMQVTGEKRLLQVNELEEFCHATYENAKIYKEKIEKWHDKHILRFKFVLGQQVMLYNSQVCLFLGKLKSRWTGPFGVMSVSLFDAMEICKQNSQETFKVNGQKLKTYLESGIDRHTTTIKLRDP